MERQKKIAVINDFSGYGRCSLTVSLPIISAMKIQCCALPTAVLSNHTGYSRYFFDDYTDKMKPYYHEWEKLRLSFDGIYTGFLGSVRQVEIVEDFIARFKGKDTVVIVDPVMGDNGKCYATIDDDLCRELRKLLPLSTIITPNLTEACILCEEKFRTTAYTDDELMRLTEKLRKLGARNIVITGIERQGHICNYISAENKPCTVYEQIPSGSLHAGTGDVFSSIIAADAVNDIPFESSVKKAADFVAEAIALSDKLSIPPQDGICFEELLGRLIPRD